ncbi:MAG: hypothetical protein WEC59_02120 [Salibacteraceae bacterium]
MMKLATTILGFLLVATSVMAQIPKNDDKQFEYHAEESVRRAGSGDLVKRLNYWANEYFSDEASLKISPDTTSDDIFYVDVTKELVESYFGVNRKHQNRSLSFHIKFLAERKDYQYWINDFKYKATEIDKKGRETLLDGQLSELKTAASKSLEEEVHLMMTNMIEAINKAAETELEE